MIKPTLQQTSDPKWCREQGEQGTEIAEGILGLLLTAFPKDTTLEEMVEELITRFEDFRDGLVSCIECAALLEDSTKARTIHAVWHVAIKIKNDAQDKAIEHAESHFSVIGGL